ncbi:GntR family transcriptional regulator [Corynebacterium jeikeium]|uniref:Putative transcriptional regulator (GntR family) n=1 Tax=Corynebacterium jeikeium (strain K411) TaxID=306537 RepID=Q4JX96_CORJK|nr:GntR family transcriptional regulator [Corynebacterium jeikeium]EEW15409.1 transcriptional regulator, GntR family [Corynebacterium jeikeium ATCC 43734]OOD29805.1 GntR family transcriptional regulator [Corynebacterium jeikeium]WCZ52952.1 HTH-type transcriptional repressor CsiR [Corynebacterium jeikeium]CAI36561.1 putative transcriptional regulator (GntR family) [Corynebacterium jeikeium K411]SQI24503.1 GntR family transcriptional regulator [Corynebacterium jeikeium]
MHSQSAIAHSALLDGIASGAYAPGEKLNEVNVAQSLGISRNTLREAFATLVSEGLLERIPNRGVFIAEPTREDLADMYAARTVLEPGALLWGQRKGLDKLEGIVSTAEDLRDSVGSHATDEHIRAIADANQDFHRAIVASAGSEGLNQSMDRILAQMRLGFARANRLNHEFHVEFIAQNRTVTDLIAEERWQEAASQLARFLQRTGDNIERYFG